MELTCPSLHDAGPSAMATIIWPLLIYWLVVFVGCYVVVEFGQDQLYDEVTPHVGLKVAGGSLLLAILLTALKYYDVPASYLTMFTNNIIWTLLQAIVWPGVFSILVFRFHPWHGLGLGLATMVLVSGLATMGVENLLSRPVPASAIDSLAHLESAGPAVGRTGHGARTHGGAARPSNKNPLASRYAGDVSIAFAYDDITTAVASRFPAFWGHHGLPPTIGPTPTAPANG